MRTAAAYIRVSTEDQTEYSPDAQLKAIYEYAEKNEIILLTDHIYRDYGISGRKAKKRPQFLDMIATAKKKPKPFDLILVHKFSRFARDREDSIVYKKLLREKCGIDVISITEPIPDDSSSVLMEAIHEAMDEFYSTNLSEEVRKGMKEKASRGEFQTMPAFGYHHIEGQPIQIHEEEAKYVRLIFDWFLAGESLFGIATKLNSLGVRTKKGNKIENRSVEYILNNPIYKGYVRWTPEKTVGRRIFDSPETITEKSNHDPIVSEEIFDQAVEKFRRDKSLRPKKSRPAESKKHYLSGILKCGNCGSTLSYAQSSNGFQCIKYAHGSCKPSHFINATKVENAILKHLKMITDKPMDFARTVRLVDDTSILIDSLNSEIGKINKMMERARDAYLNGIDSMDIYRSNKVRLETRMTEVLSNLESVKSRANIVDPDQFKQEVLLVIEILQGNYDLSEKYSAITRIAEKIVFNRPEEVIRIYLRKVL